MQIMYLSRSLAATLLALGVGLASCAAPKPATLDDIRPKVSFRHPAEARVQVVISPELRDLEVSADKGSLAAMYKNQISQCDILYRRGHFAFATAGAMESAFNNNPKGAGPQVLDAASTRFLSDKRLSQAAGNAPLRKDLPIGEAISTAVVEGLRAAVKEVEPLTRTTLLPGRPAEGFDYLVVVEADTEFDKQTLVCGSVERKNTAGVKRTVQTGGPTTMYLPGFTAYSSHNGGIRSTTIPGRTMTVGYGPKKTTTYTTPLKVQVSVRMDFCLKASVFDRSGRLVNSFEPRASGTCRHAFGNYLQTVDRAVVIGTRRALEALSDEVARSVHSWAEDRD